AWHCPGAPGDTTVVCTSEEGSVPRHTLAHLTLEVDVLPSAAGALTTTATLQGGGAAAAASAAEPADVSSTPAGFGIVAAGFKPDLLAANGLFAEREAGAHPDNLVVPLDFNSVAAPRNNHPEQTREAETIRNFTVELPPGFVVNPGAVGVCAPVQLTVGI